MKELGRTTLGTGPGLLAWLRERRAVLARVGWLAFFILTTVTFLAAIPFRWAQLTHPTPTTLANLNALGLSVLSYSIYLITLEVFFVGVFFLVALIIFTRRSNDPAALFFSLVLVAFGAANQSVLPTLESLRGRLPALDFLLNTLAFVAWFGLCAFFYRFPSGRFVPGWTRLLAAVWFFIAIVWNYASGTLLYPLNWPVWLFLPVVATFWLTWLGSQIYRYKRSASIVERQQTKWVVYGISIVILFGVSIMTVGAFIPGYKLLVEEQSTPQGMAYQLICFSIIGCAAFTLIPITIGISILRYRLWDIDLLINRTLAYGALTLVITGVYIVIVGASGLLFQASNNLIVSLLATGLAAILFQPARARIQRAVNRLMFGERDDPYAVLTRLGQRLETTLAPEAVLAIIVETVAQALKLPYVAITLREGDTDRVAAAYGLLPALPPALYPLHYQHDLIGHLHAAPRSSNEPFTPAEQQLLADIARQAEVAVHNVRLTADLQHSRERLVTTREEERRRLRRDLHDGLGPALASQSFMLDAIHDLIEADPERARQLIADLKTQSQTTLADIRRLVYELRPPALDEFGLVAALQAQFVNSSHNLRITVEAPSKGLPPLSAAVEVAAYRIAIEAMNNVARHAQARHCTVRLTANESILMIEISDDGVGMGEGARSGVGLTSMRERATELGGSLTIGSNNGNGIRVAARLPI